MTAILSIDFDGVFHRASDSVIVNFKEGTPAWQIELGLKAQKRFIWAPLLADLLVCSNVSIIIHSTWRKQYDDATLKHFLPAEIAQRVIVLDGQIKGRESISSDAYIAAALELIAPTSICVLDDRPDFFPSSGKVHKWISQNHGAGHFVWCDPDFGVSKLHAREDVSAWLKGLTDSEISTPTNTPQ